MRRKSTSPRSSDRRESVVNHLILQGRLVRDPELRETENGKAYTTITIGWNEKRGDQENRLFVRCIAWGKTAEMICNYFVRGQEIIVSGKLLSNKWEDSEGGKHEDIQLYIKQVDFCGPKREGAGQTKASSFTVPPAGELPDIDIGDDELPF